MVFGVDKGYWSTPKGRYQMYESRRSRRLLLQLFNMGALSKKQSRGGLAETFRNAIREDLVGQGRRSFNGAICLSLELETSGHQPAPIQTLAKNYLDLLGRATSASDKTNARRLLYGDDSQVHVLSVSCRHGVEDPTFSLEAGRLSDFIADLQYVRDLERDYPEITERDMYADLEYDDALEHIRKVGKMDANELATDYGRVSKILAETHSRRVVQEHLVNTGQLQLRELAQLYTPDSAGSLRSKLSQIAEDWVVGSPFRIGLPALPSVGQSEYFRNAVREQIRIFRDKLAHLIQPLKMQVGLEVLVRPRFCSNKSELFDLDNLVRDYLLPQFLDQFSPPSDFLHTVDFFEKADEEPYITEMRQRRDALPKGVRIGVVRYEVFRLPAATAESPDGYVTVNLTDCTYGGSSIFGRIDSLVAKARELRERY
jgi:hypothetical protein